MAPNRELHVLPCDLSPRSQNFPMIVEYPNASIGKGGEHCFKSKSRDRQLTFVDCPEKSRFECQRVFMWPESCTKGGTNCVRAKLWQGLDAPAPHALPSSRGLQTQGGQSHTKKNILRKSIKYGFHDEGGLMCFVVQNLHNHYFQNDLYWLSKLNCKTTLKKMKCAHDFPGKSHSNLEGCAPS